MTTAKSTPASNIEYSDPEIKAMERQLRVLETARKSVTNGDRVVGIAAVHAPDGTVSFVAATKDGHFWEIDYNQPFRGWKETLPPVPNTPAADADNEVAELRRKIAERKRTKGRAQVDDDIAELVGEEEEE